MMKKICSIFLALALCACLALGSVACDSDSGKTPTPAPPDNPPVSQSSDVKDVLQTSVGLSADEAQAMAQLFKSVGVDQLLSIKKGAGSGIDSSQAYIASASGKEIVFKIEKRALLTIVCYNVTLYDAASGGALEQLENIDIPEMC